MVRPLGFEPALHHLLNQLLYHLFFLLHITIKLLEFECTLLVHQNFTTSKQSSFKLYKIFMEIFT